MLTTLATAFRSARLELEYLTPGEITLPLTSHGAEVLDLLLVRLRELAHKVKEGDDAIDEYHSIELNLRQQLDARVSVMDGIKSDLALAQSQLSQKSSQITDLAVGNDRLKGAVDGYIRDITELERLIEKLDSESQNKDIALTERDATITDLEARVLAATQRATDLQDELEVAQASRKNQLASVNKRSGQALALRDARVIELRDEIDRVNGSLREAHETIRKLRIREAKLGKANVILGQEITVLKETMAGMEKQADDGAAEGEKKRMLDGGLARRVSKRGKRRYDSGLGLLDEDEVDM